MYSGDQSWPSMNDEDIDQFIEQAVPDDVPEEAKDRFRNLRKNPPDEGNAAKTTIEDLDLEQSQSLFYEFDFGDGWEHHIELQEIREGSLEGEPVVVDEQGDAPPQYPEYDE
ncbi:plasmid pRiA4b ORF-3 family protein [Haloterrigena sp. H1]|uniref:plasmid pRiA4b ORF-3 family protein n=1 Tax=Haloterrigena sp. H1 TaxID=2552943 RepID=UPI002017B488|nr:plasmid pRiA4b ORF-3 family protein [Haloterrigena sp. H1]